jgi:hypothetical protein
MQRYLFFMYVLAAVRLHYLANIQNVYYSVEHMLEAEEVESEYLFLTYDGKKLMTIHSAIFIIYVLLMNQRFRLLKKDRGCVKKRLLIIR